MYFIPTLTQAENILAFNRALKINTKLPAGVEVMSPYQDDVIFSICRQFYTRYYNDTHSRTLIFGINPGRFGGGLTGVPFTDPAKLEKYCGIANDLPRKPELSADFIYQMITAFGGPEKFYAKFYISAISPLGFTKDGKNLNYYDIRELQEGLHEFIIDCMQKQLRFGVNQDVCYCLGEGENFKFLNKLNKGHGFFKKVIPLAHPRFIMQYKRKKIDAYIKDYLEKFREADGV